MKLVEVYLLHTGLHYWFVSQSRNKKQLRKERALAEGLDWDSDEYDKDPEAFKEKYKSMVTYEKGGERFKKGKADNRGPGMGHES